MPVPSVPKGDVEINVRRFSLTELFDALCLE